MIVPLRFVILHHTDYGQPHYDLMFETEPGSALATYRLPTWPITGPTHIEKLTEHRRDYLDYQGPVSNNRGQVRRLASGAITINQPVVILGVLGAFKLTETNGRWQIEPA